MPERFRELKVAALLGLMLYFGLAYRVSLTNLGVAKPPLGLPAIQAFTWLGRWRMFTELRDRHSDLLAEAGRGGAWSAIDLAARYPNHWDEGPGYLRDDFYGDPRRLEALALDLCGLSDEAVRFTRVTWAKSPGQHEQPHIAEDRSVLGSFDCP
ncbi:hypothetical protein LBMAG42_44470 [Deltaproteobacteria bacterium]|nr:hypothetical protein LBMAG42_44470 [Deltaproteobacteria bacterium]